MKVVKTGNQNRFLRIITIPIRALGKAKDFYVRSMNNAERLGYGGSFGGPAAQFSALPKSFSVRAAAASDGDAEDFTELVRAASARSYGSRIDVDAIFRQQKPPAQKTTPKTKTTTTTIGAKGLPKCSSVGMGKIDEDKACDFDEDFGNTINNKNRAGLFYPRSKSYAVAKRRVAF